MEIIRKHGNEVSRRTNLILLYREVIEERVLWNDGLRGKINI